MINRDRLTHHQGQGITIITPDESARLHRVRVELQRLNERLTLWSPPGYLDRVEQALNELRPMDMRGE